MSASRPRDSLGPARILLLAFMIGMLVALFTLPAGAQDATPDSARRSLASTPFRIPALKAEVDSLRRELRALDAREAQLVRKRDSLRAVPRPIVLMAPAVADSLAARYTRTQTSAEVPEHAECLTAAVTPLSSKATLFAVTGARPAKILKQWRDSAGIYLRFRCPRGTYRLHTHSEHHCRAMLGTASCPASARIDLPSDVDLRSAHRSRAPLSVVQWGPRAFTAYAPDSLPDLAARRALLPDVYAAGLGLGVLANTIWAFDRDTYTGPRPIFDQFSAFHITAGYMLADIGHALGVTPARRLALVCAAAVGFEYSQGEADPWDMAYGCGGALLSLGVRSAVIRWAR